MSLPEKQKLHGRRISEHSSIQPQNTGMAASKTGPTRSGSASEIPQEAPGAVVEFVLPLQVWKRCGNDGKPDVYIVGIWQGMALLPRCPDPVLKSICHHVPIDAAQAAIARLLREAVPSTTEAIDCTRVTHRK